MALLTQKGGVGGRWRNHQERFPDVMGGRQSEPMRGFYMMIVGRSQQEKALLVAVDHVC